MAGALFVQGGGGSGPRVLFSQGGCGSDSD